MSLAIMFILAAVSAGVSNHGVADLSWMSGYWTGVQGEMEMEESWMSPKGGMMLGLHRDVKQGKAVMFEYLRIEQDEEGPVYVASPKGRPGTPFRLVELEGRRAVFENLEHDFPQRILYWIDPEGRLHARIEGPRPDGGTAAMEWVYESAGE